MRLNSIKLQNIRSFVDQEIRFNKGITLLSGDIGAGKSTVLMGLCFALFGISKGLLSGNALLRNGEKDGFVRLDFSVEDKEIIIERRLKRGLSISQMPGKISINNKEEIKTPIELKQEVLELLNYPREYLMKSKDLIFYYTVFTPQEEMKGILLGDKELRLETLRKVFGIDKYSRIADNASLFSITLKGRREELKGFISDLGQKEAALEELKKRRGELVNELEPVNEEAALKYNEISKLETLLNDTVERLNVFREAKNLAKVSEGNIKNKETQIKEILAEINNLKLKILKLEDELSGKDVKSVAVENIDVEKNALRDMVNNRALIVENMGNIKANIKASEEITNSIKTLDNCPVCFQEVKQTHKSFIMDKQFKIVGDKKIELNKLVRELSEISERINDKEIKIQGINELKSLSEVLRVKNENLADFKERLIKLEKQADIFNNEISELKKNWILLKEKSKNFDAEEEKFLTLKKKINVLRYEEKKLLVRQQAIKSNIENNEMFIRKTNDEIKNKKRARRKIDEIIMLNDLFANSLPNLVRVIEKSVMLKLNHEFNAFFQRFFSLLINTEDISMKLDQEFTPLITQNGHDIEYINLSGGEKTAVALAYRLALNKVLNTIYSAIRTNNLIILDEPTDGFSEEQLDRLRDVIKELNAEQIIIVSHENKIESFAENIIRLEKSGHISRAFS